MLLTPRLGGRLKSLVQAFDTGRVEHLDRLQAQQRDHWRETDRPPCAPGLFGAEVSGFEPPTRSAGSTPSMRQPCSLPFPTVDVDVGRRLRRQLKLPDIDQQPAAARFVAAVDHLPLRHMPVKHDHPQQVGRLGSL